MKIPPCFKPLLAAFVALAGTAPDSLHAASDTFFSESFDDAASLPARWTGATVVTEAHNSGLALKVASSTVTTKVLNARIPIGDIAGRRVVVCGQIKGANISTRPVSYNGAKVMLVFRRTNGQTVYSNQASVPDGSFDWKDFCFPVTVPADITEAKVVVGLEAVSGTAWFDEIRVEADPAFFRETFDQPTTIASRWIGSFATTSHGTGSAVSITNTSAAGSKVMVATLPHAVYSGHRLVITGQVKATNVSAKPNSWNGIKVMLTYTAGGTTYYPQAYIETGSFDWTNVYAVVPLPQNVTALSLAIGLEKVTGTAEFDNIKIEAAPLLVNETFDDGAVGSRWSGGGYTLVSHDTGSALMISNGNPDLTKFAQMTLPCAALRGRRMTLRAQVKAVDVSVPPNTWNGIKVLIICATPTGFKYPAVYIAPGTFDWTTFQAEASIPADATSLTLTLGLERSSGTIMFDNVQVRGDSFSPYWVNPTPAATGHSVPRLRGAMVSTNSGTTDFAVLASWKANVVRWQIGEVSFSAGLGTANYTSVLNTQLAKLDAMLPYFASKGMAVTLDLHSLSTHQFDSAANQRLLISTWRNLAARYKNGGSSPHATQIWAYDIANEPRDEAWNENLLTINELAEQVALAIREVDSSKPIIIQPYSAQEIRFPSLRPPRTNNIIASFHFYTPWEYTAQGLDVGSPYEPLTYPGMISGVSWDAAQIANKVQPAIDFQNTYKTPIYVGEFGVLRWAPGGAQYLADCISVWEQHGWDWTYHAFREWQGWNVEIDAATNHGSSSPPTSTDRSAAIINGFAPNVLPAP